MAPPPPPERPRSRCSRRAKSERTFPQLQDLSWEESGMQSVAKHPTGFGRACDVPEDCRHHLQVGATCGVAAFNNLMTNFGRPGVDAEYFIGISRRLGQAETAIRDGAQSVEEEGEEQDVSELYVTELGGHF